MSSELMYNYIRGLLLCLQGYTTFMRNLVHTKNEMVSFRREKWTESSSNKNKNAASIYLDQPLREETALSHSSTPTTYCIKIRTS